MANVPLTFFFVALVILIGFAAQRAFQSTRIPDVPLLMCLGLALGPLNRAALDVPGWSGLHSGFLAQNLDPATFKDLAPYFSQLALIVILFDSGLKLDFTQVAKSMRPALLHTLPLMVLTALGIAIVGITVWGMPVVVAVILGVALSNVGQTVSAAIVRGMKLHPETRAIYLMEMAIYDVISIPVLVGLLEFAQTGAPDTELFAQSIARVASVSITMGLLGGLVWILILRRLQDYPYTYLMTLATLLLVYSLTSFVEGSGAIAALVFGLVVGNRNAIVRMAGREQRLPEIESERIHTFHDEVTFFIRSFFFIFLGIMFSLGTEREAATGETVSTAWNVSSAIPPFSLWNGTAALFLAGVILIVLAIVAIRYGVVRTISARAHTERFSLWAVYGRGLGTAVLCTFPFTIAAYDEPTSPYRLLMGPYEPIFLNAALMVVLLTVVGTSVTSMIEDRRLERAGKAKSSD